jgi:hypothetical protein
MAATQKEGAVPRQPPDGWQRIGQLRWPERIARLVTAVVGGLVAVALSAVMFLIAALGGTSGSCILGTSCATYGRPWLGTLFLSGSVVVLGVSLWCLSRVWRSPRPWRWTLVWLAFLDLGVGLTVHFGAAHVHQAASSPHGELRR